MRNSVLCLVHDSGMTSGLVSCPETIDGHKSPAMYKDSQMQGKQHTSLAQVDKRSEEHNLVCLINVKDSDRDHKSVLIEKGDGVNASGAINSGSEESDKHRPEKKEKRKHKRSHREEVASDDSYDSEYDGKKEAKKRRKEKKSRKEEKHHRREDRRCRKEERHAEKLKFKDWNEENSSGDDDSGRKNLCPSDDNETHSEQKKLEGTRRLNPLKQRRELVAKFVTVSNAVLLF